ncbi:aquaporin-12-like [Acipenser oxyrinchus oxyrinchus]|uniref:Aquaporin n=1 Tax=Acipenser oxyrinchus oxyrinchus TaxID=40147 RepID=A0AAD8CEU6_ACIOX|nr:aquaporin-12-like [Acipenser oxyrinchus oxyrinchus]
MATNNIEASIACLAVIVFFCEVARRVVLKITSKRYYEGLLMEIISTFQLCACTHELKLLGDYGIVDQQIGLTLTYVMTVVHLLTFRTATSNPSASLEQIYRRKLSVKSAILRIACQFLSAAVAKLVMHFTWSFAFSELHLRHSRTGLECVSGLHTSSVYNGAAVEFCCAFAVHSAVIKIQQLKAKYRVCFIAGVITFVVFAGGPLTGAVFNPALAFSIQFPCRGNTFLENVIVYGLGPMLGMISSVLLFDKAIPTLVKRVGRKPVLKTE